MICVQCCNRTINIAAEGNLVEQISRELNVESKHFYLTLNGKKINDEEILSGCTIRAIPRLLGGKGGFGSMLRAIGAQIEKTTNREACRDLSGRRLRDINEEKRLKTWLSQKEEREKAAEERRRQKLEKMCQEPKVEIKDQAFLKERSELTENISNAVELGLKSISAVKRKPEDVVAGPAPKKKKKIFGESSDDDSSDSDSE